MSIEEILDADVVINVRQLRDAVRHGIRSTAHRGVAYRYLLGVSLADKSSEMRQERLQEEEFHALLRSHERWRCTGTMISSQQPSFPSAGSYGSSHSLRPAQPQLQQQTVAARNVSASLLAYGRLPMHVSPRTAWEVTENLIYQQQKAAAAASPSYWEGTTKGDGEGMVLRDATAALQMFFSDCTLDHFLELVTFAIVLRRVYRSAKDLFFSARALIRVLQAPQNILHDSTSKQVICGRFLMLFRQLNTVLYTHFFREGLTTLEWLPSMLTTLFAGRMCHEELMCVWDYYVVDASLHGSFPLHPYMCLVVLVELTEVLIECDKEEILWHLHHLPHFSIRLLLRRAVALQESSVCLVEGC